MPLTRPKAHQLSGQTAKKAVRVVTTSNITLSGSAPATVDGVSLTLDDRILVTAQTDATENGIYRVTTVGSGSNGTWVRSRDANQSYEVLAGMTTIVTEGTTYADTLWKLTTDGEVTLGTTELTFEQHSTVELNSIANLSDVTISSATSNDVLTYNGSAWVNNTAVNLSGNITGGNLITAGALTVGTVLGNLVPTSNVTYTLGTSTNAWKDLYLGPGSLYINGQKVLEDSSGTINVTADQDQNLTIKTSGTGQTTVQSAAGLNLTTTGSADISLTTSTGQIELNGNVSLNSTNTINSADSNPITFGDDIALGTNNINSVGSITASTTATVTGNITGGNLITTGLTSTGDLTVLASGTVEMNQNVIGNVGTPISSSDAATKSYVDGLLSTVLTVSDGSNTQSIADGDTLTFSGTSNEVEVAVSATDTVTIGLPDDVTLGGGLTATTTVTATGNITGGNLTTAGQVTATGNITGSYFIGNGSQLTGVTSYTDSDVASLLSNFGANNISTTGTITTTSNIIANGRVATDEVSGHGISNTTSLTLRGGTASDGIKLQFWDSSWTDALAIRESTHDILASYPFTATGNITGGNLLTGNVTVGDATITVDNVTYTGTDGTTGQALLTYGNGVTYFGNVATSGGATYTASTSAPGSPSVGDKWYDTTDDILFEYINDGTSNVWVDVSSASTGDSTTGDYAITGDFTASGNITQGPTGYQSNKYILYGTTTDATTSEIFIGGGSNSRVPVGNNVTMFYTIDIVARRTDATGESGGWTLKGVVDNFSGNVQNVGNIYEVAVARDDTNWAVDVLADNTDDALNVVVTGAAGKTVKWMATVETQEITE